MMAPPVFVSTLPKNTGSFCFFLRRFTKRFTVKITSCLQPRYSGFVRKIIICSVSVSPLFSSSRQTSPKFLDFAGVTLLGYWGTRLVDMSCVIEGIRNSSSSQHSSCGFAVWRPLALFGIRTLPCGETCNELKIPTAMANASDAAATSALEAPDLEDDNTVTLDDVLQEELQLESDANAVLGPSDDKNCSYKEGYLPRQALYSCRTCMNDKSTSAGICLACSYHCHEGHDLVELYTKRFFRCDCGNKKFNGLKCNLAPNKEEENDANQYNQNFQGLYCICARPYPDPEDSNPDDMIQCCVCEDWYHSKHLISKVPPEDNYAEMICPACTKRLDFLEYYSGFQVLKVENVEKLDTSPLDVESTANGSTKAPELPVPEDSVSKPEPEVVKEEKMDAGCDEGLKPDEAQKGSELLSGESKPEGCKIKSGTRISLGNGATYWPSNFRSLLCTCCGCKASYERLKVSWIVDDGDTVQSYEEKGKTAAENSAKPSQYEQGLKALSGLDRVQQMEAILNFNDLKDNLKNYLSKFAENKKVVREEDIREFFTQMQARKRQKLEDGTPPYVCH